MFTVKSQLFCDHYWRTSQAWLCDSMSKRNGESVRPVPWIKSAALGRDPVGSWLNAVMVAHNCVPGTCLISFPIQGLCTAFSAGDSLTLLILPLGFNLSVTFLPKGALCTIVPLPINTPHPQPILCLLHNLHYDLSLFYLLVCCFFAMVSSLSFQLVTSCNPIVQPAHWHWYVKIQNIFIPIGILHSALF